MLCAMEVGMRASGMLAVHPGCLLDMKRISQAAILNLSRVREKQYGQVLIS